ncbi:MAG: hypothetical protein IIT40_02035, partial [Prevotella sp.]|nr:hypothetical protein [Prevotella sp.]
DNESCSNITSSWARTVPKPVASSMPVINNLHLFFMFLFYFFFSLSKTFMIYSNSSSLAKEMLMRPFEP